MRTLNYKVEKQILSKQGDRNGLVAGTSGYLEAVFDFDSDWNNCAKVAVFIYDKKQYPLLLEHNTCRIPTEVLVGNKFEVYVEGRNKNGYRIISSRVKEWQEV